MEKDPAKRFQSADSFLEAVQTAARNSGVAREATQALSAVQSSPGAQVPVRKEATVLLTESIDSRVSPESAQVRQDAPVLFPPRSGQPHRGLYIGLGALIVLFSTPPGQKCRNSRYGTQRDGSRTISTSTDCSASPWSSQERPRRAREFGHGQKPCEHRKPSFAVGGGTNKTRAAQSCR